MDFSIFDVILLVLVGGFVMFGAWFGFFHTLGSLIGTVFGAIIAGYLHIPIGNWLIGLFGNESMTKIITFLVILIIVSRLIGFGFYLLDKTFKIVTNLPFIKSIDRILGSIVGFVEGILVVGLSLYVVSRYQLPPSVEIGLAESHVAEWLVATAIILQPLFPKALRELRSIIGV